MRNRRQPLGVLALVACLPLLAMTWPAAISQGDPEPAEAAEAWLATMDAKDYHESWAQAGQAFRDAVTAESWAQQASAMSQQVGDVVSRELAGTSHMTDPPGAPPGEYAQVRFHTHLSAVGEATEVVILMDEGELGWRVVGYFLQPPSNG
jgi:hypothetical protein